MSAKSKPVAAWLNAKFVGWIHQEGQRKTLREFAEWLEVKEGPLGHWLAGRNKPTVDNVHKIAAKLGDEIYDLLGIACPDPTIQYIISVFSELNSAEQAELVSFVENIKRRHDETL